MVSETFSEMCDRLHGQIEEMRQEREQWRRDWLEARAKQSRQPTLNEIMVVLQQLVAEVAHLRKTAPS